jgi:hypothetical protein
MIDSLLTLRISRALPTHTVEVVRNFDALDIRVTQPWFWTADTQVDEILAIGRIVDEHEWQPSRSRSSDEEFRATLAQHERLRRRIRVIPSVLARVCLVVRSAGRRNS